MPWIAVVALAASTASANLIPATNETISRMDKTLSYLNKVTLILSKAIQNGESTDGMIDSVGNRVVYTHVYTTLERPTKDSNAGPLLSLEKDAMQKLKSNAVGQTLVVPWLAHRLTKLRAAMTTSMDADGKEQFAFPVPLEIPDQVAVIADCVSTMSLDAKTYGVASKPRLALLTEFCVKDPLTTPTLNAQNSEIAQAFAKLQQRIKETGDVDEKGWKEIVKKLTSLRHRVETVSKPLGITIEKAM